VILPTLYIYCQPFLINDIINAYIVLSLLFCGGGTGPGGGGGGGGSGTPSCEWSLGTIGDDGAEVLLLGVAGGVRIESALFTGNTRKISDIRMFNGVCL
jgi:hypothetical protein